MTKQDIEEQIGEELANETGLLGKFVVIYRDRDDPLKNDEGYVARKCAVWEFLVQFQNQIGTWFIDGGWGGPPGPIRVTWNEKSRRWECKGFC